MVRTPYLPSKVSEPEYSLPLLCPLLGAQVATDRSSSPSPYGSFSQPWLHGSVSASLQFVFSVDVFFMCLWWEVSSASYSAILSSSP